MTTHSRPNPSLRVLPSVAGARVVDAMSLGVVSCPASAPAVAVARLMATQRIHAVVVEGISDDAVRGVWGVVSDADLLAVARAELDALTAAEIAVTEPLTVESSLPLDEAIRLMVEHELSHLIVADAGRPVGVLSSLDIAGVIARGDA